MEFKDPAKKTAAAKMGAATSKAIGGPPVFTKARPAQGPAPAGVATKANPLQKPTYGEKTKEELKAAWDYHKTNSTQGPMPSGVMSKARPEQKPGEKPAAIFEDKVEEDMAREDMDIFGVDDVCDVGDGSGAPLFSDFEFEDWELLSLRFEFHLLLHVFLRDAKDADCKGIAAEQLASDYKKYFKKDLLPKTYGVKSVTDIIELVEDTAITGAQSKVVEPTVAGDLLTNEIFVMLTEESRQDRKRRIDAGDESRRLKFLKPAASESPVPVFSKGSSKVKAPAPALQASMSKASMSKASVPALQTSVSKAVAPALQVAMSKASVPALQTAVSKGAPAAAVSKAAPAAMQTSKSQAVPDMQTSKSKPADFQKSNGRPFGMPGRMNANAW